MLHQTIPTSSTRSDMFKALRNCLHSTPFNKEIYFLNKSNTTTRRTSKFTLGKERKEKFKTTSHVSNWLEEMIISLSSAQTSKTKPRTGEGGGGGGGGGASYRKKVPILFYYISKRLDLQIYFNNAFSTVLFSLMLRFSCP